MNKEALMRYKMTQTQNMENLKKLAGKTISVEAHEFSDYIDSNGAVHNVLAVRLVGGQMYRTECGGFIEDFKNLVNVFADEYPPIKVVEKTSKRGNVHIRLVVDEEHI